MNECKFEQAWIGKCKTITVGEYCLEHTQNCVSCGLAASRNCHETGQFVCGAALCDNCEHTICEDGTNGGIGFGAMALPKGMKRHCKKSEQVFKAWFERESK